MVMSQGTYTFLACFAGFWLIWAAVVLFCCFCSFLQRRLKHHREERLREAESVPAPPPDTPQDTPLPLRLTPERPHSSAPHRSALYRLCPLRLRCRFLTRCLRPRGSLCPQHHSDGASLGVMATEHLPGRHGDGWRRFPWR
ncbi:hypothetical protein WMY93_012756 [Mugilogobius chulae]|uniref:Proline-rich protein 7 n=1 Tax=Mugilogobius chulae TaxID=88201 RepID=A0AAW0NXJ9_9GOBI